jgi:cyclic pyranopterin phosphate synthase
MPEEIQIYTDGACKGNPGPGGWGTIVRRNGEDTELSGHEDGTTNNRMEIMAAIKGLETVPEGSIVTLYSDSQYLVNTMIKGWKRRVNGDLWNSLDILVEQRDVNWQWVRGHAGHPENERADKLATHMTGTSDALQLSKPAECGDTRSIAMSSRQRDKEQNSLTHVDEHGKVKMVDVGWKAETQREAVAKGSVVMQRQTLELIQKGEMEKGDVLSVARIAGIMGAKRTSDLIPLCHPLPVDQVKVELELDDMSNQVQITATAKTTAKTGVEMEALTAVSIAALTIYDMCKAVDRSMHIESIRLVRKQGGKSGNIVLEE